MLHFHLCFESIIFKKNKKKIQKLSKMVVVDKFINSKGRDLGGRWS